MNDYETFKKAYNLIWYGEAEKRDLTDVVKDVITAVTNDTLDNVLTVIRNKREAASTTYEERSTLAAVENAVELLRRRT